jgi:2',3'-cyclic-nucleotide 2'-phosphodiesterase/3'-nucleotidase
MLPTLLLAGLLAFPVQDTTAHLVVVSTTDVHGHATAWDYLNDRPFPGGLVRAGTVVDSLRRAWPGQVVLVDAGDLIQGDPLAAYLAQQRPRDPHPVLDAMSAMGYDAATPGNHEFNFGLPFMHRALAAARFPYVSANVRAGAGDSLMFEPWVVLQRGGVRVGITGFTTPGVMVWDRENVRGQASVGRILPAGSAPPSERLYTVPGRPYQ